MKTRWLIAAAILFAIPVPVRAQGLLERLGKLAREAGKAVEQPPPGQLPPAPPTAPPNEPPIAPPAEVAPPGYLGLTVDEPARGTQGAPVIGVREGSPAADAGFKPGDVVVSIDGTAINSLDDFQAAMTGLFAGDRIRVKFVRQGTTQNLSVRLADRTALSAPVVEGPMGVPFRRRDPVAGTVTGQKASLGVTVMPISDEARRKYGLDVARGALVTGVRPGSPADAAGITIGSAIVALDGKRIDSAEELINQISTARPGQEVEVTFKTRELLRRKAMVLAASEPGPIRDAGGAVVAGDGDRPLLRRVESVLGNIAGRGGLDVEVAPGGVAASGEMRQQIIELQSTVDRLNQRVKELEARLSAPNPSLPPPPPADAGKDLPLTPPKQD